MIRIFLNIMRKDALQLRRTPVLMGLLVLCPLVVIGLIPFGMENRLSLKVQVVDQTHSEKGREVTICLNASPHITATEALSIDQAQTLMDTGEADSIVLISPEGECGIITDASHSLLAQDAAYYIGKQLTGSEDENERFHLHPLVISGTGNTYYYITALLVLLMAIISCCLVGLSIIGEKLNRQLEYYRSEGMSATVYVLSKIAFFTLVTLLELAFGLIIGRLVFGYQVLGPLPDFFLLAACFVFCVLNLGVLMAAVSKTLIQTVYGIIFLFFVLMLLGTLFAPVDNMSPFWAATRYVNPFFWMSDAGWKIALRGFSLSGVWENYLALLAEGSVLTAINIRILSRNGW